MRRTGAEGPCWAELTLASETHGLVVARRELDGDAKVTVNGHLAARAPRGVTAYFKSLFGMDERTWGLALECPQKQLDGFSRLRPAERREQLLRWLGVLRLDKVLEGARKDGDRAIGPRCGGSPRPPTGRPPPSGRPRPSEWWSRRRR